jgi:hypothetical protein
MGGRIQRRNDDTQQYRGFLDAHDVSCNHICLISGVKTARKYLATNGNDARAATQARRAW